MSCRLAELVVQWCQGSQWLRRQELEVSCQLAELVVLWCQSSRLVQKAAYSHPATNGIRIAVFHICEVRSGVLPSCI